MAKKDDIQKFETDLAFPIEGVDEQRSYSRQKQGTSADSLNVRAFDPLTDRARGGSRPGQEKLYYTNWDDSAVTQFPIQDINQLTTVIPAPLPAGDYQQFTYAQLTDAGVSIGDGRDGALIATGAAAVGYQMACSCWDDDGYVYVAMINTTSGSVFIYKFSAAGVLQPGWPGSQFLISTGSLRYVAGMTVIKISAALSYLFVALRVGGVAHIYRLNANTRTQIDPQPFTATHATYQNLTFSTASHNCLSSNGSTLAVESAGNGTTNQGIRLYDPRIPPVTRIVGSAATAAILAAWPLGIEGLLSYTGWGGTGSNQATRVVTDGSSYYCIASVTASKIKKVSAGGVLEGTNTACYQTTGAGDPLALDIDIRNGKLIVASSAAPYIRFVNTSSMTGAVAASSIVAASGSPGSAAQWDEAGSDGNGTYMLWRNSAATNNFMTIDATATAVLAMGTLDIPNTIHYGATVNKGVGSAPPPPGASSTILVSLLTKGGEVFKFTENGPQTLVGGQSFSPLAPQVFSAQSGPNMFFADGSIYKYYKGPANATAPGSIADWTPTDGTLPRDTNGKPSKLICLWNGRIVLVTERNFFMSRQFDALDWDYNPTTTSATDPFQGNADLAGELGDLITCLAPFSDDTLIFGCDHSIYQLTGDPLSGGAIDRIAEGLGIAFGRPFAFDPQGTFYFMGSDSSIYKMVANSQPIPISRQIRRRLQQISLDPLTGSRVVMAWDQAMDGLGVWVSPIDKTQETTNFFWERQTEAWQPDKYGDPKLNPMAAFAYDGDLPQDRQIYLGGRDGYIRRLALDGGDDDGYPIESHVLLGPIKTKDFDNLIHERMLATLGEGSGEVTWKLFWGKHAEEALNMALAGESPISGTWRAGRNRVSPTNREGFAFYLKLSSSEYWVIEKITQAFRTTGMVRRWQ